MTFEQRQNNTVTKRYGGRNNIDQKASTRGCLMLVLYILNKKKHQTLRLIALVYC